MLVSVNVPDQIASQLHLQGEGGEKRALEMFALEGYRAGELSRGQISAMLDLEVNETMAFLKEHGCTQSVTLQEFEEEARRARELFGR